MNLMLDTWGAPRPQPGPTGMSDMPHSAMEMHGMMTEAQMQQLASQTGTGFDRLFLQMMIEHHTGAVEMARAEAGQGQNPQARQLAVTIAEAQQQEIAEMQALLARV